MVSDAVSERPRIEGGRLKTALRALNSRNYRLFFSGQLVSLIGMWIGQLAMSWLIYEMTGSRTLLGFVAFSGQVPAFLLGPWAGVLVDRWKLQKTIIVTQTLFMSLTLTLAILTLAGVIAPAHIILIAILQGVINAFDLPARQAFLVKMVDKREDLPSAIALNSMMFNSARLVGPAVAGGLIAAIGTGNCLLLNGLSFSAVLISLFAIKMKEIRKPSSNTRVWAEFREGFGYVYRSIPIRSLLVQLGAVSLLVTPYTVLLPVFTKDIYSAGPGVLGGLTAAIGSGALIGGLALASRSSVVGLGKWISTGAMVQGAALILFSITPYPVLGMICLAFCGLSQVAQMSSCNTVLQTIVDDDKRGRVMAFYSMAFMGTMPLGSLLAGILSSTWIGAGGTVALCGVACVLIGVRFARRLRLLRRFVRPIYRQRGVLPPIAEGLKAAQLQASDRSIAG